MKAHFLIFFFSFLFNFLSFPFSNLGFLILLSWLPRAPRHALGPTALGDGGVPSGFLFYIRNPFKINLEQKSSPRNLTHLKFYLGNRFNFFLYPLGDSSILHEKSLYNSLGTIPNENRSRLKFFKENPLK